MTPAPPATAARGSLRVVTINVWGRRGAWDERRAVLKAGLSELKPDLISMQEAVRTSDYDMVADLLGSDYHIAYQQHPESDGQSAAVASRWPFDRVHEVEQRVTTRITSAATTMLADLAAPDPFGRLLFVNHLPCWQLDFEYERELQAVAAARRVEELLIHGPAHVILAGDLTDPPDAASVRFWTGRQSLSGVSVCYRDAWESMHDAEPGDTYSRENPILADWDWPFRRLDYVLVRCGEHGGPTLQITMCERIFDAPVDGVWASDHFGVMADLTIPFRPSPPLPNRAAS
jgi:endonuclease/exonuclease/phosphatase family metal-dependent hydrolase